MDSSELAGPVEGGDNIPSATGSLIDRLAFALGSAGLVVAMMSDALAVLGRHAGFVVHGSIEMVQASVVVIASTAMVLATLHGSHATVHILTNRLRGRAKLALHRAADLLSAALVLVIAAASIWIAVELWGTFERTELIGISLRWLRLLWIMCALLIAGIFIRNALVRSDR